MASESARKSQKRKPKYRKDGTGIWEKRSIDGPGVWVTCVKGKERQTVGEIYDLFESLADDLWPKSDSENSDSDDDQGLSLEDQIAKEVATMKKPRHETRFSNCQTNTTCALFISCKSPVDPVKLVETHVRNILDTGVTRTRSTLRLVPVSKTCLANEAEIKSICRSVVTPFFAKNPDRSYTYKIELRMRNHTVIPRPTLINWIVETVPSNNKVELQNPQVFILVEVFKSVCGISVTENYYDLLKYNVVELAHRAQQKTEAAA